MKSFKLILVFLLTLCISGMNVFAGGFDEEYEESELTKDADRAVTQGEYEEAKGDRFMRQRPGTSMRHYERAGDYYSTAKFLYNEVSVQYEMNIKDQIAKMDKAIRSVHVKFGKARKSAKGR